MIDVGRQHIKIKYRFRQLAGVEKIAGNVVTADTADKDEETKKKAKAALNSLLLPCW